MPAIVCSMKNLLRRLGTRLKFKAILHILHGSPVPRSTAQRNTFTTDALPRSVCGTQTFRQHTRDNILRISHVTTIVAVHRTDVGGGTVGATQASLKRAVPLPYEGTRLGALDPIETWGQTEERRPQPAQMTAYDTSNAMRSG